MRIRVPPLQVLKQSRWYKRLLWAGGVFLVYVLIGFFVLPPLIKSQLVKRLPPITKRQVEVRHVKFNPLALSLTLRGLALREPSGEVFASWEELYVNFQLSSAVRLAWTFDEIGLKEPYAHIALLKDGRFNFANLAETNGAPEPKPKKAGGIPRIHVALLHIDDGAVTYQDDTRRLPFRTEFKPINIALTNLTTRPGKSGVYSFHARSDSGRSLSWTGTLVAHPFQSRGRFELVGAQLPRWTPILREFLKAEMTAGRLAMRADYAVAAGTNGFQASVTNCGVELAGLQVKDLNSGEIVTSVPWLALRALDFDLGRRELHVGRVRLAGFSQVLRLEQDGTLNLAALPEPPSTQGATTKDPQTAPAAPWVVSVDELVVHEAAVSFADLSRSNRFETVLKPIRVRVERFTTRPESDAAYEFSIASEAGEKLSGNGKLCIGPLRSDGGVRLEGLEVRKYAPYYESILRGEVASGKVDAGLDYRFAASSNAPLVTISNAGVAVKDLQLKTAGTGETVVSIPLFAAEGAAASLADRKAEVGLIRSSGGTVVARQSKDGQLNLLGLLKPAAPTNAPAPSGAPWTVLLKEIAFDGYAVKWEDQKLAKPAALSLDQLGFNVQGLSTVSNRPIAVSLSGRLNQAGTVAAQGTAKIAPLAADLEIGVSDLDLRPFQPYVNEHARVGINSGRFNLQGRARYAPPGGDRPVVEFAGGISLTNLATTDLVLARDLVKWDAVNVTGVDFKLQPGQLQVQEVNWRGLQASVIIGPDGRPNFKTILTEKPGGAAVPPPANTAPAKAGEFPVQLGALVLQNAAFHFTDESIEPHCAFDVQELSGTVKGLSSQAQATATVDLGGKVAAASPFGISGKVNPLAKDLQLDLAVAFTNTDLTAFSTYLEKFAGHPLNKGKLFLGLRYDINQKQLKAENKFRLDHLTLGPRNDSTNATSLPVKLAVALLKDRQGQINLDVPLSGRTDDPKFRIGPIILKVVLNLIMKAATSPFSLLGALVGGGEELSFVEFQPGRADLPNAEVQKLDKLVKALYERPALNLEIAGSFDPTQDRAALARLKLEEHFKLLNLQELTEAGKTGPSLAALQLDPAQRERLLKRVFAELGTNHTLVLRTAATPATNAAPAPPGPSSSPAAGGRPPVTRASGKPPSTKPAVSDLKGAAALLTRGAERSSKVTPPPGARSPAAPDGAPLTLDQLEARLVSAIAVSGNEQRDLINQRAQAVQSFILKSDKVAADRLFIVTPKSTGASAQGQSRVNFSLN